MRPDMKIDRYEISNQLEFRFCLHEKVIPGRSEISSVYFSCKVIENKYGGEKYHGKPIINNYYNYYQLLRLFPPQSVLLIH